MSYSHLTRDQRCQIYTMKSMGYSQVSIAEQIGVSAATIGRELRRNRDEKGYSLAEAHKIAGVLTVNDTPISHATIYRHVWKDRLLGGKLYKNLRHRGKKYNGNPTKKPVEAAFPTESITVRPKIVERKTRFGD